MVPSGGWRTWLTLVSIFCRIPFLLVHARRIKLGAKNEDIGKRDPLSDSGLESASWIWTSAAITGNVAFLKTFPSTAERTAISATISMTAVNQFTLWVNGNPIGASGNGADAWKSAQVFNAVLNASTNTFSVLAVNNANSSAPAPGLLAAIQIKYNDNLPADRIVSDSSWAVSAVIPSDFPSPSDPSHFSSAAVAAPFGSGSWGNSVTVPSADPNALSLSGSTWIWSTSTAATEAAVGTVGFRKTVATPSGKTAQSATVLITVDNGLTLYLNGKYAGAPPPDFPYAQQFQLGGVSAASNTFTVFAANLPNPGPSPAGVVAAIRIQYSDGSSDVVGTDTSWLSGNFTSVSSFLSTPDSGLSATFAIGTMGAGPWGQLAGIANALDAASVPSAPFASGTLMPSTAASSSHPSSSGSTETPSAHTVPVGLIVGPILGGLALLLGASALLCWRRGRRSPPLSEAPNSQPLLLTSSSPRMSAVLVRAEPAAILGSLRPPLVQAGYPQPYPQPPSDGPRRGGVIPPTKLQRENIAWQRPMTPSASSGSSVAVGSRATTTGVAAQFETQSARWTAEGMGLSRGTSSIDPSDAYTDRDIEEPGPPSYDAQGLVR
ncbi:hypothetical protein B0H17DRAFT_1339047 [Mycena rosella]|uniref:Uncharacterized protein n=1 Tax=Mycena rosella TaxID=1033263 RepID=A0AAD7CD43_MYCRO|nr:hypothetical protein B0H17DRAFT_1339047 [Mycena rosella]